MMLPICELHNILSLFTAQHPRIRERVEGERGSRVPYVFSVSFKLPSPPVEERGWGEEATCSSEIPKYAPVTRITASSPLVPLLHRRRGRPLPRHAKHMLRWVLMRDA